MKVLFLDIDGVMISQQWIKALYRSTLKGKLVKEFCPICISNLIEVLQAHPDVKIVVHSSHRKGKTVEQLKAYFESQGIPEKFIYDKTDDQYRKGDSIGSWLDQHPEVTTFVIVDDEVSDMGPLRKHVLKTKWPMGLMADKARRLIKRLSLPTSR